MHAQVTLPAPHDPQSSPALPATRAAPLHLASDRDRTPPAGARAIGPAGPRPGLRIADAVLRLLDVLGALAALIIALPLMLAIAAAIRLDSPGPVLFRHRRIGQGGQGFACLKFRTMVIDADAQLAALFERDPAARAEWLRCHKLRCDPRVTRVGRWLRRTSLDELPQLLNVLGGSMSLVGPRPIVESEIARYGRHFVRYCALRPGITGLWQVSRGSGTSYRRRVACDIAYTRSRSLWLYLQIMARTVPTVLTGRGAW